MNDSLSNNSYMQLFTKYLFRYKTSKMVLYKLLLTKYLFS